MRPTTLSEPSQPELARATSSPETAATPGPVTSCKRPRRTLRAWPLITSALTVSVGLAAGFAVGLTQADGETSAGTRRSSAIQPAPAFPASGGLQPAATPACLETARRADELIDLLS